MKMLKKKSLLLSLILIMASSCTLEEEVFSDLSVDSFKTTEDAQAAITAVYSGLLVGSGFGYYGKDYFTLAEVPSDVVGSAQAEVAQFDKFTATNTNTVTEKLWKDIYDLVANANIAIARISEMPVTGNTFTGLTDESVKNSLIAEARFLRGLAYYDLTDLWGRVPLVTQPLSSSNDIVNFKPSKATKEELDRQILDDFNFAAEFLPDGWGTINAGRADKSSAWGMLTKFYLRERDWNKVVEFANKVINEGSHTMYTGHPLELWNADNVNNSEFLFSVKSAGSRYNASATLNMMFTVWAYNGGWSNYDIPITVIAGMEEGDLRRETIVTAYGWTAYANYTYGYNYSDDPHYLKKYAYHVPSMGWAYSWYYPAASPAYQAYQNFGVTIPILRYTDIYLAKAEATNEISGPGTLVIDMVNEVRIRSGLPALDVATDLSGSPWTTTSLRMQILQERKSEFVGEGGKRRQDLIRHNLFEETLAQHFADLGLNIAITSDDILHDIPLNEQENNPNLIE